ncbi:c-type cytochrome [Thiohalocapsa marina]|uniref:C-type cytochrome n=2 Tax=Thiohalocapsa marina TaxID=424902 RepID=A0A5M8FRE9_9GAMM|nr:c-type cytochrome [Thiohalocapsa marina]KAA6186031.1 c-type cytochrome [Thiohalocapsa marina]
MIKPTVKTSLCAALLLAGLGSGTSTLAAGHGGIGEPAPENWTAATLRETLAAMPAGDAERGKELNQSLFCASCHGNAGVSPSMNWPHLAGQKADYTVKMMLDYQSGLRLEGLRGRLMHHVAVLVSEQEITDLAAFYATLPAPEDAVTPRPEVALAASDLPAEVLVRKGDPRRLITPCASCHGDSGQGGRREAPELAGQNPLYFVRTMHHYHDGVRANDGKKTMRAFAYRLTPTEIDDLAAYYADLPLSN